MVFTFSLSLPVEWRDFSRASGQIRLFSIAELALENFHGHAVLSLKIPPFHRFWRLTSTPDVHANVTHVLCKWPYNICTVVFMHDSRTRASSSTAAEYSGERANIQRTFENRYLPGSELNVPFARLEYANFLEERVKRPKKRIFYEQTFVRIRVESTSSRRTKVSSP